MDGDLREQACWLLLAFESGLTMRIVNDIIILWCHQLGRTLQDFFAADAKEWSDTCQLGAQAIEKLEQAKEKQVAQAFLIEQLAHNQIHLLTLLDKHYPKLLKDALKRNQTPPILSYAGDLRILERTTMAVIGSRNANETSIEFTRLIARYLAAHEVNVISGNARGVDTAAYEGAIEADGYTTVVLPHGIRKLSGKQMRSFVPKIEAGKVLLLSQFPPDAPWLVSRAMERNKVVTGLAQTVIVAESGTEGGTWEGAKEALRQNRPLYVRQSHPTVPIAGNEALIKLGGKALPWPIKNIEQDLAPLLDESRLSRQKQDEAAPSPQQLLLLNEKRGTYQV